MSDTLINSMLTAIEAELQRVIGLINQPRIGDFHEMFTFTMGWTGKGAGLEAQGKRLRPLLVLLTCAANNTDWKSALPAAACVELIHNFSLVHDDIQDQSDLRRGRPTVWKNWGMPQAINVGDALFILAHLALFDLRSNFPPEIIYTTGSLIHNACINLTCGQYLDISYEKRTDLTIEDYWPMTTDKTAALLAACTEIGAILGGAQKTMQEAYKNFGHYLGLAFQVQDDFLGIWGDSALTGKSNESDLMTGKKTLPVLFGIGKKGPFARQWAAGPVRLEEISSLADQLAREGAKSFTQETADQMTDMAMQNLRAANPQGEAGEALFGLAKRLLNRYA